MNTLTILDFIKQNFSEERHDLIIKALYIFDEYDRKLIYSKLDDVLMDDQLTTTDSKVDNINKLIELELISILKLIGVYMNESSQLQELLVLVETINTLENLEDITTISNIVNEENDPELILIKLAQDLLGANDIKLLDQIEFVTESFIKTLRRFVEINELIEEDKNRKQVDKLLSLYFKIYGTDNPIGKLYNEEVVTGESLNTYIKILDNLEFNDAKELSELLLGLFIYSGIPVDSIVTEYKKRSDELVGDLDTIMSVETKLISLVNDFVMRLNIDETSRVL